MNMCPNCKKEIFSKFNKFCNSSCSASYNNKIRTSRIKLYQYFNCLNCNKEYIRRPNQIKKGHKIYCSQQCSFQHKIKINTEERNKQFKDGRLTLRSQLRKIIFKRDGHVCCNCKLTAWLDKPIPLWLDHIDGNASNNKPENLRLICLNCDALGTTFGSKNKGKGRRSIGLKPWA